MDKWRVIVIGIMLGMALIAGHDAFVEVYGCGL